MNKYKVILVDDHQLLKDGIALMLKDHQEVEVIAEASNGKEAISLAETLKPDLLVMDLDMPLMNGILASKHIKKEMPHIKVMILSLHAEKSIIQELIEIGIDSYLLKNTNKSEFIRAINEVRSGNSYFSSNVTLALTSRSLSKAPLQAGIFENEEKKASLSDREIEILKLIAQGFTNKEIGEKLFLSYRTIDSHRASIMNKLDINKVTGLVRFALKVGLID